MAQTFANYKLTGPSTLIKTLVFSLTHFSYILLHVLDKLVFCLGALVRRFFNM